MNTLTDFFNMGGYAFYVWTAYGSVIAVLFLQWLIPWRKWRFFLKRQQTNNN